MLLTTVEIDGYGSPLRQHTSGDLIITGAGALSINDVGHSGGFVSISASNLILNAPVSIFTAKTVMVNAANLSQGSNGFLNVGVNGTLSVKTTGSQELGVLGNPIKLAAPNLNFSTQSSAFISLTGDSTIGQSSILGDLSVSSTGNLYSSDYLQVSGLAVISSDKGIGKSSNAPFLLSGQPYPAPIGPPPKVSATLLAEKSIYVQTNGSLEIKNAASTSGNFYLRTTSSGSITLDGAIRAGGKFVALFSEGLGSITLDTGSSISASQSVRLEAGGGGARLDEKPSNIALRYPGQGSVELSRALRNISLIGVNVLNASTTASSITINPGLNSNPAIRLNGTTINVGWQKPTEDMVPVSFVQNLLPESISKAVRLASRAQCDFISLDIPELWEISGEKFQFRSGHAILRHHSSRATFIGIGGDLKLRIRGKVILELRKIDGATSIVNLTDYCRESVMLVSEDTVGAIEILPGQQLILGGQQDRYPIRDLRSLNIAGKPATLSQISLAYLLAKDELVTSIKKTKDFKQILLTAACLQIVRRTASEPYKH